MTDQNRQLLIDDVPVEQVGRERLISALYELQHINDVLIKESQRDRRMFDMIACLNTERKEEK